MHYQDVRVLYGDGGRVYWFPDRPVPWERGGEKHRVLGTMEGHEPSQASIGRCYDGLISGIDQPWIKSKKQDEGCEYDGGGWCDLNPSHLSSLPPNTLP